MNGSDIFDRLALTPRAAQSEAGYSARTVRLVPALSIPPVETRFVLAPYIPRGEATWIEGVTKSGKTMALCDIIARITHGESFPTGATVDLGRCVILTCEDSPERTIIPRLIAAQADLSRVSIIRVEDGGEEALPSFLTDLDGIERGLREDEAALVCVDGTFGVLGVRDSNSYTEAYSTMLPFVAMVRRLDIGAPIVRHVRKTEARALDRGMGSAGFASLARSTISVAVDRDDETGARRLFAHAGSNVGEIGPTICFTIEGVPIDGFERTVGRARWGEIVDVTADEAMSDRAPEDRTERDVAEEFLRGFLAEPTPAGTVSEAAEKHRISRRTLYRAAKGMGVKMQRRGFGEGSLWIPPDNRDDPVRATNGQLCHDNSRGTAGTNGTNGSGVGMDRLLSRDGKLCERCRRIARCYPTGEGFVCASCEVVS